jgi:hypothetical protein
LVPVSARGGAIPFVFVNRGEVPSEIPWLGHLDRRKNGTWVVAADLIVGDGFNAYQNGFVRPGAAESLSLPAIMKTQVLPGDSLIGSFYVPPKVLRTNGRYRLRVPVVVGRAPDGRQVFSDATWEFRPEDVASFRLREATAAYRSIPSSQNKPFSGSSGCTDVMTANLSNEPKTVSRWSDKRGGWVPVSDVSTAVDCGRFGPGLYRLSALLPENDLGAPKYIAFAVSG